MRYEIHLAQNFVGFFCWNPFSGVVKKALRLLPALGRLPQLALATWGKPGERRQARKILAMAPAKKRVGMPSFAKHSNP